jgi:hypothetical protein
MEWNSLYDAYSVWRDLRASRASRRANPLVRSRINLQVSRRALVAAKPNRRSTPAESCDNLNLIHSVYPDIRAIRSTYKNSCPVVTLARRQSLARLVKQSDYVKCRRSGNDARLHFVTVCGVSVSSLLVLPTLSLFTLPRKWVTLPQGEHIYPTLEGVAGGVNGWEMRGRGSSIEISSLNLLFFLVIAIASPVHRD